jgi:hypothetical protein
MSKVGKDCHWEQQSKEEKIPKKRGRHCRSVWATFKGRM